MTYPRKLSELIPWAVAHAEIWKTAPATLGLSVTQAAALDNAAKAAATAYADALAAREKSKIQTATQNTKVREMLTLLQQDIDIIRFFALNSADPDAVFQAAQLEPPQPPQPVGPPAQPTHVTVCLNIMTGAPELAWKASNPPGGGGITYIIKRKLAGESAFTFVGVAPNSGTDARQYTDNTLPLGTDSVSYSITGTRSGVSGASTEVVVRFGSVGTPPQVQAVKMAA
ncbi:MAG TPA: hypothetical protein VFF65_08680 [Phycisphaerales bacterium]|nr:hypothetical protein [Phycisphaerales bacterium]